MDSELERRRTFHVMKVQMYHLQLELLQLQAQLSQHQHRLPKPHSPPSVKHQWRQRRRVLLQRHVHILRSYRLLSAQVSASSQSETALGVSPFSAQLVDANELFPERLSLPFSSTFPLASLGFPSCCCTESALLAAAGGSIALLRGFGCTDTCGCRVCVHGRETGSCGREPPGGTFYSDPDGSSRESEDLPQALKAKPDCLAQIEGGAKTSSDSPLEQKRGLDAAQRGPNDEDSCSIGTTSGEGGFVNDDPARRFSGAVRERNASGPVPPTPPLSGQLVESDRRVPEDEADREDRSSCLEDQLLGGLSPVEVSKAAAPQSNPPFSPLGPSSPAADRPGLCIPGGGFASPSGPAQQLTSARADLDDEFEFDDADLYDAHQHPAHRGEGLDSHAPDGTASLSSAPSAAGARSAAPGVPNVSPVGPPSAAAQVSGQLGVGAAVDITGAQQLAVGQQPAHHSDGLLGGPTGFVSGSLTSASGSGLLSCQTQGGLLGEQTEEDPGAFSHNHSPVVLRESLWGEVEGTLECAMTRVHRLLHWKKKDPDIASAEADAAAREAGLAARLAAREAALADGRELPDEEEEASVAAAAASAAVLTLEEEESTLATERADALRALESELDRIAGKASGQG